MSLAAVALCAYKMSTLMMNVSVLVFKAACQELQMCSSDTKTAEARSWYDLLLQMEALSNFGSESSRHELAHASKGLNKHHRARS